ncbi:YesL family protein [Gracilibacillus massiliensis]|uniref:YesL family protein n=1 Tax=Gracilibacillus massiliensis TaxID=1564956 RepID=UPI00071D3B3F|nr:DUF624 domain-containing protein [Gracilibacillus massiliensis]
MDYNQGGFYRFSNYVYCLLILNFIFVFTNLLSFAALILLIPTISNAILYYIALIPTGPAIAALLHSLSILARQQEMTPVSTFLSAYKSNFKDVLKVWFPILTVFFVLVIDIQYFNQNPTVFNQILNGIFLVVLFLLVIFSIYTLIITTHYKFRIRDIYRLSLYYIFTWIKRTTGNIAILFLTVVVMFFTSDFIIIFLSSLVAWFIILNTKPIIQDVKISFVKNEHYEQQDT